MLMGLFNLFKRKNEPIAQADIDEVIALSKLAINMAIPEIEKTKSFLPFGGSLTIDDVLEQVVYANPNKKTVDHREHATIIQELIQKKFKDQKCKLIFMAFDGIAHLPTGDVDSINVRVSNKAKRIHRILTYPYKIDNKKVKLVDIDNPIIRNV